MEADRLSIQSGVSGISGVRQFERPGSDIRLTGNLKKLKTMKKKFFVLRSTSSSGPARLEYYDSEKKFLSKHLPKRSIYLHTCFNINRKSDSRHKNAIALYTKDECFSVICDDEKELERWLQLMLDYQHEYVNENEKAREHYEYVWQVNVQPKGLGQTMNIRGLYRLCMSRHHISLVKLNKEKSHYDFHLETIRSLAHNDNLFRMEVGKIAPTGEGELWMQAEDALLAQNLHETILNFMKSVERRNDNQDFRPRTTSEVSRSGRTYSRSEQRPMSVHTNPTRSASHSVLHPISPGTSPYIFTHSFDQWPAHRTRSDSQGSRHSQMSAVNDDLSPDTYFLEPTSEYLEEEEPDLTIFHDQPSVSSPLGSHFLDPDGLEGQRYMDMTSQGSVTPPTQNNSAGYMDMTPTSNKDIREAFEGSTYISMNPPRTSSAPITIHQSHGDSGLGYMEMSSLPTVKEGGSSEGYLPMSPSCSASPCSSSSSHLKPDRAVCMLTDDSADNADFQTLAPTRTYSLGSRPVKTAQTKYSGYVDMSGRKSVLDNGRSCSAPHLITHHYHLPQHHPAPRSTRSSFNMESPTTSASPLSTSLRSDDSDSFMELDFCRPRTASDSYSYRPRASSFGMAQKNTLTNQGHRPRSSSHGQGTRPLRHHKVLDPTVTGRLGHDLLLTRSQASSHGSFDSLRVSSSESLRKHSQDVRTKISERSTDYMDMGLEKRHTPSPQPGSASSSRSGKGSYVDMTVGQRKSSPSRSRLGSKSNSKTSSAEKLQQESEYTDMTRGSVVGGGLTTDSVYVNYESQESGGKKESPSRSPSSDNVDSYIMYEPATTLTGASPNIGKGATGKNESSITDPRTRSGSGGKEQKNRRFFTLRGSHSESSKSTKTTEQPPPNFGMSYSRTGGDKFGSLNRNVPQKSKDNMEGRRNGGQKAHSFSRTLGIKVTKPGKIHRKTPTPPKSLDGNDEYIEFAPTSVKSDSDSSHSSGSSHKGSRSKSEVSKEEVEYVGFEPGCITSSSISGSSQHSNASSGYASMSAVGDSGYASMSAVGDSGYASMSAVGDSGYASMSAVGDSGYASMSAVGDSGYASMSAVGGSVGAGWGQENAVFKPATKSELERTKRCKSLTEDAHCHVSSSSPPAPVSLPSSLIVAHPVQVFTGVEKTPDRSFYTGSPAAPMPEIPPLPEIPPIPGPSLMHEPPLTLTISSPKLPALPFPTLSLQVENRPALPEARSSTVGVMAEPPRTVPVVPDLSSTPAPDATVVTSNSAATVATAGPSLSVVSTVTTASSSSAVSTVTTASSSLVTVTASAAPIEAAAVLPTAAPTSTPVLPTAATSTPVLPTAAPTSTPVLPTAGTSTPVLPTAAATSTPVLLSPVLMAAESTLVSSASSSSSTLLPSSPDSASSPSPSPSSSSTSSFVLITEAYLSPKEDSGYMHFDPGKPVLLPVSPSGRVSQSAATMSCPTSPTGSFPSGTSSWSCNKSERVKGVGTSKTMEAVPICKLSGGLNGGNEHSPKTTISANGDIKSSECGKSDHHRASLLTTDVPLPGLTRPDSSPNMIGMDKAVSCTVVGRGRGRHASSSSTQGGQGKKGRGNNCGGRDGNLSSKGDACSSLDVNPINLETDARHSVTDLSGYEVISFPSNALSKQQPSGLAAARQQHPSSSSQGSGSISGSQGFLNYITLDLGSTDSMGDSSTDSSWSPRNKSRHPSSAEEKSEPLSYAKIDFEKSESLREKTDIQRGSGNKDNGKRNL